MVPPTRALPSLGRCRAFVLLDRPTRWPVNPRSTLEALTQPPIVSRARPSASTFHGRDPGDPDVEGRGQRHRLDEQRLGVRLGGLPPAGVFVYGVNPAWGDAQH